MIFDFFKRGESNVLKFPETKVPYVNPPKRTMPKAIYTIGTTAEGKWLTFQIGYSTLTMTKEGCQDLIDKLEFFKNKLEDEE